MSLRSTNSSSSANSSTVSSFPRASRWDSPIITPLMITFSRALSSGLKPTPNSMKGAGCPAIRIDPLSAR